jgi:hypothetical protein
MHLLQKILMLKLTLPHDQVSFFLHKTIRIVILSLIVLKQKHKNSHGTLLIKTYFGLPGMTLTKMLSLTPHQCTNW